MEAVCGKNWESRSLSDALGLSLDWKTFCPFGLERRVLYKRVGELNGNLPGRASTLC